MLFVRLFGLCLFRFFGFLFLLGSGKGLRFVIVALPGLSSYLCCQQTQPAHSALTTTTRQEGAKEIRCLQTETRQQAVSIRQ